jgi:hypothetical protein
VLQVRTVMGEHVALVVARDARWAARWRDAHVVHTLLDMIRWLERLGSSIATVILGDDYARDREIVSFLREMYPAVEIVIARSRSAVSFATEASP